MKQNEKEPVDKVLSSEEKWRRASEDELSGERKRENFQKAHAKGNPKIDKNIIKGYN
jgi:hypothetical protein